MTSGWVLVVEVWLVFLLLVAACIFTAAVIWWLIDCVSALLGLIFGERE